MDSRNSQLTADLQKAELSCLKACEQIIFLTKHLDDLHIRYDRADKDGNKSFRYSLRLKIVVGEGLRRAYYEYAWSKADLFNALQRHLHGLEAQYETSMENEEDSL